MATDVQTNLAEQEPVLISAPLIGALVDWISGTGANSHWAAVAATVLVALLRLIVTSPATTKRLKLEAQSGGTVGG